MIDIALRDFHKRVILNEFSNSSNIYPMSIILPEAQQGEANGQVTYEYRGVHLAGTESLLSLLQPKLTKLEMHFSSNGDKLITPFDPKLAFSFYSVEIGFWCERVLEGKVLPLEHCSQSYLYRDKEFEEFKCIAAKLPIIKALAAGRSWSELDKPTADLALELDATLLRVRKMLI